MKPPGAEIVPSVTRAAAATATSAQRPAILIVEDEADAAQELAECLNRAGYRTYVANAGNQALMMAIANKDVGILLCDIWLPEQNGLAVAEGLRRYLGEDRWIEIVYITGHGGVEEAIAAVRLNAADFLRKPVAPGDVLASVLRAEQAFHRRSAELTALRASARESEGSAPPVAVAPDKSNLLRLLRQAGRRRSGILPAGLDDEVAWQILLDLAAAEDTGRHLSVSEVCYAARASQATAFRRVDDLCAQALVARMPAPQDRRRTLLVLTKAGQQAVSAYLHAVMAGK